MNRIKLVIFDMDGLMFDTEKVAVSSWLEVGQTYGYPINEQHILETIGLNKVSTSNVYKTHFGEKFPFEDLYNAMVVIASKDIDENGVPIKEGLIELLEWLEKRQIKKAVATSTSRERAINLLDKAGILDRFDTVLCGDEVLKGKPEPEIFIKVCKKLNISEADALVLEDSEMGLIAAHRAEIKCILIPDIKQPSEENKKNAYAILKSLVELKDSEFI